jgi:hypothetical protein
VKVSCLLVNLFRASIGDLFLVELRIMLTCGVMGMSLDHESMKKLTLSFLFLPAHKPVGQNVVNPGASNEGCQL